ncbi:MAG: D-lactate dehydrogenase, partial [Snodgrassella sp.]|nr:D-lactate dehydrogenase [Snodgrassella sp.]
MGINTHSGLVHTLQGIVGQEYTLTDPAHTLSYRQGIRFGVGDALAVVLPGTLVEQWRVLKACV